MNDSDKIREDVERRGITRLCHFMQSRKLAHVLNETQALLPTSDLKEHHPDLLDVTDQNRIDGRLDHICCSVEYPNSWYFEKVRRKDELFTDWLIICLDPCLLWETREKPVLFCRCNAATESGSFISSGLQSWKALFQPEVTCNRTIIRSLTMLACCPTDGQAEVLIPGAIPLRYIKAVVVKSVEQAHIEQTRLNMIGLYHAFEWRVAPDLFTTAWRNFVERRKRPNEKVFKVVKQ